MYVEVDKLTVVGAMVKVEVLVSQVTQDTPEDRVTPPEVAPSSYMIEPAA